MVTGDGDKEKIIHRIDSDLDYLAMHYKNGCSLWDREIIEMLTSKIKCMVAMLAINAPYEDEYVDTRRLRAAMTDDNKIYRFRTEITDQLSIVERFRFEIHKRLTGDVGLIDRILLEFCLARLRVVDSLLLEGNLIEADKELKYLSDRLSKQGREQE